MRIAVVTSIHPDFDARIWKHVHSLAENGMKVDFISPWRFDHISIPDGVSVHVFPRVATRVARPVMVPYRVISTLRKVLAAVDIVHFHDLDLLPWMSAIALRKPVVYDVHENYPDEMLVREWIPSLLRKPLYYCVRYGQAWLASIVGNCVFVVESQLADFSLKRIRRVMVRNYASVKLLDSAANDYGSRADTIVFTGGHHKSNGTELMLEVASLCASRMPYLRWISTDRFISSKYRAWFEDELRRRNLAERFSIIKSVPSPEIMSVLNRATIGISPNLRTVNQEKAIPTKLFEYMAAGLPFVTSDLPFQSSLIKETGAGMLASPDDPTAYATAIEYLVGYRDEAFEMGRRGQSAFAERYSWESQVPSLMNFYEHVIRQARSVAH